EEACLVFDIGGTNLRCGVYEPISRTLQRVASEKTPSHYGLHGLSRAAIYQLLLETIQAIAVKVLGSEIPRRICVAFPGPIDAHGCVIAAPTVWAETAGGPIDIIADLRRLWGGARIEILNDVVAAGYRYCENQGRSNFCIVTVSSGIGNKIFLHSKPYLGPSNRGGETGHTQVDSSPNAPLYECGGRRPVG